jgi:diacylglycerol O-acyltransferase / wax synthase
VSSARLSALDAAFLTLESAHAPMHVGWAAVFGPRADGSRPTFEAVRDHVESRLGRAPRYRQRLAEVPLGVSEPVWVDDPDFDIARHVRQARVGDLGHLTDEVMSVPLTHGRPLWELWVAEDLPDGRLGVVGKAHHCLVDGLAAVELMALLLDLAPEGGHEEPDGWAPASPPSALELLTQGVGERVGQAVGLARRPLGWVRHPKSLLGLPGHALRATRAAANSALPIAPPSTLNGPMPPRRHLAWCSRPLEDLKIVKRRFDATINDVLLAASAGALRELQHARGQASAPLKAMVPVSVGQGDEWGNSIAFMFLELPCHEANPAWRLRDIHVAMRDRKRAGEPEGAATLLSTLSLAPRPMRNLVSRLLASPQLSNLTISNIPGPQVPLYLMGCEAERAYPVVPLTDGHGISIGMTTIHDRACFGIYAQAELAEDADRIAAGLDRAIDLLLSEAVALVRPEILSAL